MDKEKYAQKILNFYAYNFYLEKMPLEIYHDEKNGVKCAVMQSKDNKDVVMMVSAGASLIREESIEAVISISKEFLKDEEGMKLLKEFHRELMEQEYDVGCCNGTVLYPSLFVTNKEFYQHFGKRGYALAVRNGGDPVYVDMDDDELHPVFVFEPIFLTKKQLDELLEEVETDEDKFYDHLSILDDDENCSLLK